MSAVVKCDKCKTEREDRTNNGFSRLTFWVEENGQSTTRNIDLCSKCTTKMTNIVMLWLKEDNK